MTLSQFANFTISTLTAAIKTPGFGIVLIADYHTRFSELIRFYTDTAGMLSDGFTVNDGAYKAAQVAFSQNPQPKKIAIGRRQLAPDLTVVLTPVAVNSKDYVVKVTDKLGASGVATYTSDSTATLAEISAGLKTQIDALGLAVVTTDLTGSLQIKSAGAGQYFSVAPANFNLLTAKETHADPGIASDLANIRLADDSWYGLSLTTMSDAEVSAAATWAEANGILYGQGVSGGDVIGSGSGDIASTLKTASDFRTLTFWHSDTGAHAGVGALAKFLPLDPGSAAMAFKQIAGVASMNLNATQITNLLNKNCNFIAPAGGLSIAYPGKVAAGEWIDIIRDRDAFVADLQTGVFLAQVNANKIAFTDRGINSLEGAVRASVTRFTSNGFIADDTAPVFIVPKSKDVATNDRANRTLNGLQFSARVAGAILVTNVTGTLTA